MNQIYRARTSRVLAFVCALALAVIALWVSTPSPPVSADLFALLAGSLGGTPPRPLAARRPAPQAALAPSWGCYDPGNRAPCHNILKDISMLTATDGWAVGKLGAIEHWDGVLWRPVPSNTREPFTGVDVVATDSAWAVANRGIIFRWDGTQWLEVWRRDGWELDALDMLSPTEGWVGACGTYCTMLHWDGQDWREVPYPATAWGPWAIDMLSATDGWVVSIYGTIVRWNGATWEQQASPTGSDLYDVDMLSPTEGWAVGMSGTALHWDGTTWTGVPGIDWMETVWGVGAVSATDVWAITGHGQIWHWDGQAWSQWPSPIAEPLYYIAVVSADDIWATGNGRLVHWDGQAWSLVSARRDARGRLDMLSPTEGWATGRLADGLTDVIWRWDGLTWELVYTTTADIGRIYMRTSTDGWVVGKAGVIVHWDGVSWSPVPSPVTDTLRSVYAVAPDDAWAVGYDTVRYDSTILHWDGSAWTRWPITSRTNLEAVDMVSATDGWAVGTVGPPLHWNGTDWVEHAPDPAYFNDLDMLSSTDGWAVGSRIYHWDGAAWTRAADAPYTLMSVSFAAPDDGWTVGYGGTLLHWDGSNWSQVPSPYADVVGAVDMVSSTDVWAIGGAFLRYSYNPWLPNLLNLPQVSRNAQGCGVPAAWNPGAPAPAPVARAAGVWFPPTGRFYALGGRGADMPGTEHLAPYEYDPQAQAWLTASAAFDDARVDNLVAGVLTGPDGPRIYTVGGSQAGVLTTTRAVRVYDPIGDTLTVLASDPWPGNAAQDALPGGAAVVANKLYVLGGYRPGITTLDTIWELDPNRPAGARWALMPVTLPVGLMHIPATTIGNVIYTAGGVVWDGTNLVDTTYAYRYDPAAQTITAIAAVPRPSSETSAVTAAGSLWLLGGGHAAPTAAVEIYDPATNTWSAGLSFAAARRMAAADVDPATGRIFIAGGYAPTSVTRDVEVFVPEVPCR